MDHANGFIQSFSSSGYAEKRQQQPSTPLQNHLPRNGVSDSFRSPLIQFPQANRLRDVTADDLPLIDDVPLDAFDKELLAQLPPEQQPQRQPSQSHTRVSFLPRSSRNSTGLVSTSQTIREDLLTMSAQNHASSSSSTDLMSSPTASALQNRQKHCSSVTPSSQQGRALRNTETKLSLGQTGQQPMPIKKPTKPTRMGLGHAPPVIQGIPLVPSTELPDRYRSIFPYPLFNAIQSKCFQIAFETNDNLVLSAPTGSGKTAVMELAICQLMATNKSGDFKAVYQAPTKSLCSERMRDWSRKFSSLGLKCAELTGDTEFSQLKSVQSASIIITTPEKWDSVTRKWKDNIRLIKLVKLFLIDEVHILKESRGATLEAVVSRMKSVGSDVRFVALSATVPNSNDIATWLGKTPNDHDTPANLKVFGEEFRPVPLQKDVWAVRGPPNEFIFDFVLNDKVKEAIARFSNKKPTMVFCPTKKIVADTAKMLANLWNSTEHSRRLWPPPKSIIRVIDQELMKFVRAGVAFHHGAMDLADRRAVEEGFLNGDIHIICCTSTLAVGVNLPCYLVIVKGTVGWGDHGQQEYSDLEVMQMLGRAGRPQFESSACAVILTRPEKEQHYRRMVSGEETLESCLHLNLIDHLNSEIGLGTISDVPSAKRWLAGTFLSVRLQRNPNHYQLKEEISSQEDGDILERICRKDLKMLQDTALVTSEGRFKCTEFGDAMARYCVRFETMRSILRMPPKAKISEILSTLAQASEFRDIKIKSGEKSIYKEMNNDAGIRFPIKIDIAQSAHKVSLLIQTELGSTIFPNKDSYKKHRGQYKIDKNTVFSHVNRLIRCFIDCQLQLEDSVSVRHALELARSLAARVWDSSSYQLKQLDQIGDVGVRKLATAGINSIDTLQNTEPHRIEHILGRNPPFGQILLTKAIEFPILRVTVKQMSKDRNPGFWVNINFKAEIGFVNEKVPEIFHRRPVYVCFLADTSHGRLIDFRRFKATNLEGGLEILLSIQLERPTASINCHVMCDEIAGTSRYAELKLDDFPAAFFPAASSIDAEVCDAGIAVESNGLENIRGDGTGNTDEFGDLEDGDFLAVERDEDGVEVIYDIDEVLRYEQISGERKSLKRTASHLSRGGGGGEAPFFPPVQLKNGRWTCQHPCKQDGKKCQHKCCVEGVAKPAKAKTCRKKISKDPIPKSTDASQQSKISKPSPFEKACSMAEGKKSQSATKVPQAAVSHPPVYASKVPKNGLGLAKAPSHTYEKGSRPHLSFLEDANVLSKEDIVSHTDDVGMGLDASAFPHEQTSRRDEGDEEGIYDFDMTEFGIDEPLGVMESNSSAEDVEIQFPLPVQTLDYANDLGGFEAPLTHVVPTETQKSAKIGSTPILYRQTLSNPSEESLSVTGDSSSPYKTVSNTSNLFEYGALDESEGFAAFFPETEDIDYDSSSAPVKKQKPDLGDRSPLLQLQNSPAKQDFPAWVDVDESRIDKDEEMRKRMHKEEQKRRWEEFDPALYVEYGEYVDIVD